MCLSATAASGDVQAYQIRTAATSAITPGVVMATSPALGAGGVTEEVTRKREVRLMKNRWEGLASAFEQLTCCQISSWTGEILKGCRRFFQGGSSRVSQEEEGIRQVSGEPRRSAGEPEQDPHRGTQSPQRLVLPQI